MHQMELFRVVTFGLNIFKIIVMTHELILIVKIQLLYLYLKSPWLSHPIFVPSLEINTIINLV